MPEKKIKILITGGTGLLGQEVGRLLAAEGYQLFIVSRKAEFNKKDQLPFPAETVLGDLAQSSIAKMPAVDGVIHLMGESIMGRWTESKKQKILNSRELATKNLVQSLNSRKLQFFISASAAGIYGSRGDEVLTEESALSRQTNDFLAEVCKKWEAAATGAGLNSERIIHARMGMILHPEKGALQLMKTPFKLGVGGVVGSGQQYMSWIHVHDCAKAYVHFVKNTASNGVYNLSSPQPVTNHEFSQSLAKALRRPLLFPVPEFAAKAILGEMSQVVLDSQRVIPDRLTRDNFNFKFLNLIDALADCLQV